MTLMRPINGNGNSKAFEPISSAAQSAPLTEERLAILGHEIRNPLNALSFAIEALPSSKDKPHLLEDLIQVMHRQVAQLTHLCDDLLDTGRIHRGSLTVRRTEIELGKLIQHAREQIQPFIEQCGHTMTLELGDLSVLSLGDASRLTQVFANLMHNAAKFTDRNGHLSVSLQQDCDTAVISFRDNGKGINKDHLQTLFTAANVSKPCSDGACSGLGIGLRLAKTIVELHGGKIEAFSEGLGCGSTFVVRIPIVVNVVSDAVAITPSSQILPLHGSQMLPSMRIVVVDDDRSIRFLMTRLLQNLNQSVTAVDDGETALQLILQGRPNIAFIDLQMHGMTGLEIAKKVRSRSEMDGVTLIALSGNADAVTRRLAAYAGFDQYLAKPTSSTALAEILRQVGQQPNGEATYLITEKTTGENVRQVAGMAAS